MKALSVKDPWVQMMLDRLKTIETRTWKTYYRGDLLICCSKKPSTKNSGLAVAIVNLYDCKPMVPEDEERACCGIYPGAYSWFFDDLREIKPFPVKGQLNIFDAPIPLLSQENVDSLSNGTKILVSWSGWNRFADYLYKDGYAWTEEEFRKDTLTECGIKGRHLDFVGSDKIQTNVILGRQNIGC